MAGDAVFDKTVVDVVIFYILYKHSRASYTACVG